ncbi:transporter [Dokdonia sp. Hel_I_53]|uniref:transporter n=1 Tax=Dokdonia sp. Hel_I_53 TaxID=1566287 RepID=UPI001198FFAA|nr:transporter [Dokdonia sp. Hel_I_53]TVZ51281.1 outer membrane putative beta-barrel porin/alpha-amylase [Dokdonia sp. Hel_I_53]
MKKLIDRLLILGVISVSLTINAQYTETINSNRPGESQGAFSVGRSVAQLETGFDIGNDSHELLRTDTDITGFNAALRYGLLFEQLELNADFRYQRNEVNFTSGTSNPEIKAGIETLQVGAKYLLYDPYKYSKEEINLYSYHANNKFKWKTLIPAVSVYGGAVFDFEDNKIYPLRDSGVSPTAAIITQHNWGPWVWVNNVIFDRISSTYPTTSWITTMTHSFSSKFAGFGEYQIISGDLYADYLFRGGAAYLITDDFQIDVSGLINLKNTPSRWNVSAGLSYRLDLHKKDDILKDTSKDTKKIGTSKKASRKSSSSKRKRKDGINPDGL